METEPAVAVICAMESEAVHLRRRLAGSVEIGLGPWRRTRGRLGETLVDLVLGGIGLINSAAATATLCALARPRAILNYGCAGAHRDDIHPGDVVIADRVVHFSSLKVLPDGAREYWGFRYTVDGEVVLADAIPADPALLALAREAAGTLELPGWPGAAGRPSAHVGVVGSADVWTQHGESIRGLHALHGSLCEEMEAAAIGQVAGIHRVPFLALKDISNNELQAVTDLNADTGSVLAHVEQEVGLRASLLAEAVIRALPRS